MDSRLTPASSARWISIGWMMPAGVLPVVYGGLRWIPLGLGAAVTLAVTERLVRDWCERGLGRLAAWGISKTPKALQWSIARIKFRPCLFSRSGSEIVVEGWTWHDPGSISPSSQGSFLLQIDRLTVRLSISAAIQAVRQKRAVDVELLLMEGLRFSAKRDASGALNLWEALDLPDEDQNVSVFMQRVREQGGLESNPGRQGCRSAVQPLPPISTTATRRAAARREPPPEPPQQDQAGQPRVKRCDTPLGNRMRRPRWGVKVRFNIQHVSVLRIELWITDLLIRNKDVEMHDAANSKIELDSVYLSRRRLHSGDPRRRGQSNGEYTGDGIHGIYLGELVWVLLAEIVVGAVKHSPSQLMKSALVASGYGLKDAVVGLVGGVLQMGISAQQGFISEVSSVAKGLGLAGRQDDDDPPAPRTRKPQCRLQVHLVSGKHIVLGGRRVNAFVRLDLLDRPRENASFCVDRAESEMRIWTRRPAWNQDFELGPVTRDSWLRVTCLHRGTAVLVRSALPLPGGADDVHVLGVAEIPIPDLMMEDRAIDEDGDIVGWFPLNDPQADGGAASEGGLAGGRCTGQLKLRLRLLQPCFLLRPESLPVPRGSTVTRGSLASTSTMGRRQSAYYESCAGEGGSDGESDGEGSEAGSDSMNSDFASIAGSAASLQEVARASASP